MDFKGAFRHTSGAVKWALGVMFGLGLIGLVIGFAADYYSWWGDLSFVPNILTSLVSFGIGLPIAFFIISTVIDGREEAINRSRIETLTHNAWRNFQTAVSDYFEPFYTLFYDHAREVVRVHSQVHSRLYRLTNSQNREDEFKQLLNGLADSMEQHLNQLYGQQRTFDQRVWSAIQTNWNYMQVVIKARRLEAGLSWFHPSVEVDLDTAVRGEAPDIGLFEGVKLSEAIHTIITCVGELPSFYRMLAHGSFDSALQELDRDVATSKLSYGAADLWSERVMDGNHRWKVIKAHAERTDITTFGPANTP